MKREEKIVEPMFPRLHVKDADKGGGPRAPPRNKMALYEQLTIPSQRFTDRNGSLPRNTNTFFPSPPRPSNQQPYGVERNLSTQHLDSSASSGHVTQMSVTENVSTLPHHRDQRKLVREEYDFAVPVYNNNSSRRFGRTKSSGTVKEKRTTLVTEEMDVQKSASGCDRVKDSNTFLRQESRSSRLDQDETGVVEIDKGIESHGNSKGVDSVGEYCRSGRYVSVHEEACDGVSDDLMVDASISNVVDVSPDEVVGVLGQKRFWRARKAIANQQRIFAVQLFELHRLIKVQRLIASASDVLLDEISYLGKVSAKSFPVKKKLLPTEFIVKPSLPHATKHRSSNPEKTEQHKMECSAENVVGNQDQHQPSSNPPAVNGCYYPSQLPPSGGNQQWLIPVMSPSEGLIYKPHPGPGHTGPVCGGYYGHFMPAPMLMGNFMSGVPPPFHPGVGFQSPGNGYFPPYGVMPTMMNPYGSGQQQQPSSVNEAISQQARKSRQRSIGSSPSGPEGVSSTNSFRPLSVVDDGNNEPNEQMMTTTTTTTRTTVTQTTKDGGGVTRVIKVVPHNAKLASENAARIFRSIQEERNKHYDSFPNHP